MMRSPARGWCMVRRRAASVLDPAEFKEVARRKPGRPIVRLRIRIGSQE
jgi:hypothetical protein